MFCSIFGLFFHEFSFADFILYSVVHRMRVFLFILLGISSSTCDDTAYMVYEDIPNPGPVKDTVYQMGSKGGAWTDDEVTSTRRRILQMINPHWQVKDEMFLKKRGNNQPSNIWSNKAVRQFSLIINGKN